MKNLFKFSVLSLFLVVGFTMNAAEGMNVKVNGSQNIMVQFGDAVKTNSLKIWSANGDLIWTEHLKNEEHKKTLNLQYLPDGVYYLDTDNGATIYTTTLFKNQSGVAIQENSRMVFKPVYKLNGKNLGVGFTNISKKDFRVTVYDDQGHIVNTAVTKELHYEKSFNFAHAPSGVYRIVISSGFRTFSKTVTIS